MSLANDLFTNSDPHSLGKTKMQPGLKNYHTSKPEVESAIDRDAPEQPVARWLDEDDYFQSHSAPSYLTEVEESTRQFMQHHRKTGKRIVLVTSGGTTVPLENNTVRFIDNFSAGTRGATSAEYFLENDYAVIFLHREFSLLPYSRHYSHTTNCFLDYMVESDDKVQIDPKLADEMLVVLRKYNEAKSSKSLLLIPFTTVNQYLYTLRTISQVLKEIDCNALFYLAAAVSDFFLPSSRLPKHKIQAQPSGKLNVDLEAVPKFLRRLVDSWAPKAMIVSFKLETDNSILIKKASEALHRYHHQLVIGNLLQTRKQEVVFVTPDEKQSWIRLTEDQINAGEEIERIIIPSVISEHDKWIENCVASSNCITD